MLINFRGQKRLVTGKQDVMAGGEATEHIILNHVIRLVFKEDRVRSHTRPSPARQFLVLQGVDRRLRIDDAPRLVLMIITPSFIRSNAAWFSKW
jgi:hypothetical protein